MIDPRKAALLVIDMQYGFIDKDSALCVAGAEATLPSCARALSKARDLGVPVLYICREYAADGADVESTRFETWLAGGKPLSTESVQAHSLDIPSEIAPESGEQIIFKPRFSAFFGTEVDQILHEAGIETVILTGTTTPNCIRTTCYDALSANYNVVIIEDCTSSRNPEVQAANIEDMAHIGAQIIDVEEFCTNGLNRVRDIVGEHHASLR